MVMNSNKLKCFDLKRVKFIENDSKCYKEQKVNFLSFNTSVGFLMSNGIIVDNSVELSCDSISSHYLNKYSSTVFVSKNKDVLKINYTI